MATRYRFATTASLGTDGEDDFQEIEVEVSFSVAWGSPGTGRPYYGPVELYDEGSPDEIEDVRLELVDGAPRPEPFAAFGAGLCNQEFEAAVLQDFAEKHGDAMLEEARERELAWAE